MQRRHRVRTERTGEPLVFVLWIGAHAHHHRGAVGAGVVGFVGVARSIPRVFAQHERARFFREGEVVADGHWQDAASDVVDVRAVRHDFRAHVLRYLLNHPALEFDEGVEARLDVEVGRRELGLEFREGRAQRFGDSCELVEVERLGREGVEREDVGLDDLLGERCQVHGVEFGERLDARAREFLGLGAEDGLDFLGRLCLDGSGGNLVCNLPAVDGEVARLNHVEDLAGRQRAERLELFGDV